PLCFFRTWIGLLVWTWMAFMNPHRLTWDFAYSLPFSEWVAMATLGGLVFSSDRKPFVWTRETILFLALWAWFCITTLTAMYPEAAWGQLERVSKIFLMSFLVIPFFQDRLPVVLAELMLGLLAFGFAPQKWVNRIDTIVNYQQDGSAMGRLTAWSVAFQLATDNPITGGGFWSIINGQTYRRYLPDYPL